MKRILRRVILAGWMLVTSLACGLGAGNAPLGTPLPSGAPARSFHLGFTPFPYDLSQTAVDFTYAHIASDADLIAIHMDNGIPWPEALAGAPFDEHILDQWNQDRSHIPAGHAVYVAITPINLGRDGLAPYRAAQDDLPLPVPWDGYGFDSPQVAAAYLNYALRVVDYFQPDYLNVGIEANLVMKNAPQEWLAYLQLQRTVYAGLKSVHPDLPVFISLTGPDLLADYTDADHAAQLRALQDVAPFSDYFALSLYPFMTGYGTDYPASMWTDLWALNPGKPVAIAESGMLAETLELPSYGLHFEAQAGDQERFVSDLLSQADSQKMVFVVNFVLRDYDALWEKLGRIEWHAIWKDTGLYDQDGEPRPALVAWRTALARPYQP